MTTQDLMKLADKFAFFMPGSEEGEKARQALLDALEALGREIQNQYRCIHSHAEVTQKAEAERDQARAELAAIRATDKNAGLVAVMQEAADRLEGIKGGSVSETIAMMRKALSKIGGV